MDVIGENIIVFLQHRITAADARVIAARARRCRVPQSTTCNRVPPETAQPRLGGNPSDGLLCVPTADAFRSP